jgi:hypothetical protein
VLRAALWMKRGLWMASLLGLRRVGPRPHAEVVCWQCENPDRDLSDYLAQLRAEIPIKGWLVQYVAADRTPWAYTIGLHRRGLPELLVTGLDPHRSAWLLNAFAKRAVAGRRPVPGRQVWLPAGTRLELVTVTAPDAHMDMAVAVEGPTLTAIQLVWADGRGRWPWGSDFDGNGSFQPVLGVRGS